MKKLRGILKDAQDISEGKLTKSEQNNQKIRRNKDRNRRRSLKKHQEHAKAISTPEE